MEESKFRGTGRTTRMLEAAIELTRQGHDVIVYIHWQQYTLNVMKKAVEMGRNRGLEVEVISTYRTDSRARVGLQRGILTVKSIERDFDWLNLRSVGLLPSTIALVDHYALELQFPVLTQMLYRFMEDIPSTGEHHHRWRTRYITVEGVDCAAGMECECGDQLHQDDVEDLVNHETAGT